ncbi:MAG: glutamyl-tRNA reductase [Lentisphaerae bacterium]|jgi:glutamyl-tRNA reductase|nr:glutamyl-tRNA reductase [Lentisphaerota bacterium]MBT4815764.1 glutamyl-tRNA reductase [Lentisphaerota bacterium]MBT5604819.1 glutamyl-tRNA reductase [Lentisphaerota bacterium]MBT7053570.1 glutamyl-tRNA reductase [Lentisphaerota bacterium]MBT7843407.1 glutamyl-tRNA reductase [Lentisphaerota bacterium]
MNLLVLGVNFRDAPVEYRERVSLGNDEAAICLQRLAGLFPELEFLLLSTCNRTELVVAGRNLPGRDALLHGLLQGRSGLPAQLLAAFYLRCGTVAVGHLLRVAASLDSMVVGETEILGQIKEAYLRAGELNTLGAVLDPLMQQVLRVAKRVRSETDISAGRVSVGSIAADLACRVFDRLSTKQVAMLGAGEIGEQTMRALIDRGVDQIGVFNRSLSRAQGLAERYGGVAFPGEQLGDHLADTDILITSTSAAEPILGPQPVRDAVAERHGRPLFILDLAVPRDVHEAVGTIDNVYLYNIDDLQGVADENLKRRRSAADQAEAIVEEELSSIMDGAPNRDGLAAMMKSLETRVEEIKAAELTRIFEKRGVAAGEEARCMRCRDEIRAMLHRALNKMTAAPKRALQDAARNGNWDDFAEVVEQLFDLPPEDDDSSNT